MANTVQANIEINTKMNTSSVDEGIQYIIKEYNELKDSVDKSLNEPSKVTADNFNKIITQFEQLSNYTINLDGLITHEQFSGAINLLNELGNKINEVGNNLGLMMSSEQLTADVIITGLKEVGDAFQSGIEEPTKLSKEQIDELLTSFNNLVGMTSDLKIDLLNDGTYDSIKEKITQVLGLYDSLVLKVKEYNYEVTNSNNSEITEEEIKVLEKRNEAFRKNKEAIENLRKAQEELNNQKLVEDLIRETDALEKRNEAFKKNKEAIENLKKAQEELTNQKLVEDLIRETDALEKRNEAFRKNKEAIENLRDKQQEITLQKLEDDLIKETDAYEKSRQSMQNNKKALEELKAKQDELIAQRLADELSKEADAFDKVSNSVRDLSVGQYGGLLKQLNSSFRMTEEEREEIERENEAIEKKRDKIDEEYQAWLRLNTATKDASDFINEFINTGEFVKSVQEREEELKILKAVMADMKLPGEEDEGDNEGLGEKSNNLDKYTKLVEILANKLGISNKEAVNLAKGLGLVGIEAAAAGVAIGVIVGVLKLYVDRLKEAEQALIKFGEGALDAGVNGVEFFIDAIHSLVDSLQEAMEKMYEFAEAGEEIQRAYYNTFTVLGSEAGNDIVSFTDKLEELYGLDSDALVKNMQSVVNAAGSLGVNTENMVKATKNMTLMAEDLSMIAGDFEKASNDIGNAISKGFVGRNSSLYVLMTKQEKDELKQLGSEVERYNYLMGLSERIRGRYADYLKTEAGRLMILRQQYEQLTSNISKLALGLYAKIAPVLTKLIELANIALNYIMKVFNIDIEASADTGTGSIADSIAKSFNDIDKNADKANKSVKELKKQVASFDDVIQINDDKKTEDDKLGNLNDVISDIDLSKLYNLDSQLEKTKDEFERFKELLSDGNYYGAGLWIADWLADKLEEIPWKDIQDKVKKTSKALAEFLDGIIDNKRLWGDIGHTIAEGLNTAIDGMLIFAQNLNFKELGDSIGVAWRQFWNDFSEVDAAKAMYEWFMGAFELLGGLFDTSPLSTMASSLVGIVSNFFNNITDADKEQMAHTLKSILNDVFTAAIILLDGAVEDTPKLIELLKNLLNAARDWFDNGGGKEKIREIGNNIIKILDELLNSGLAEDASGLISDFMDEVNLSEILSKATEIAFKIWREKTALQLKLFWEEVKAVWKTLDIGGSFESFGQLLLAGVVLLLAKIWEPIQKMEIKLSNFWDDIGVTAKTALQKVWIDIKGLFKVWLKDLKEWVEEIKYNLTHPFENLNPFKNISLPSFNISMPWSGKHATGGITNGASIGMIGEAGREAILPLDKNTGWMDILASKISNNGNNSSPVVIDISSANKPVYTRSEYLALADVFAEAMKARGMVVSMEY